MQSDHKKFWAVLTLCSFIHATVLVWAVLWFKPDNWVWWFFGYCGVILIIALITGRILKRISIDKNDED